MRIVHDYPPHYEQILLVLPPAPDASFCVGDLIYNPSGKDLSPDIVYHESIHSAQQGDNPMAWWTRYLTEPEFRLAQEIEAYGMQYQYAVDAGTKGKMLDWVVENMALALSGASYGNLIEYGAAVSKIRKYAKQNKT